MTLSPAARGPRGVIIDRVTWLSRASDRFAGQIDLEPGATATFDWDRWMTDQAVQLLDMTARGAHHHLIGVSRKERPFCSVPADDDLLSRWCMMGAEEWAIVSKQLFRQCWHRSADRWFQVGAARGLLDEVSARLRRQRAAFARHGDERAVEVVDAISEALVREPTAEAVPLPERMDQPGRSERRIAQQRVRRQAARAEHVSDRTRRIWDELDRARQQAANRAGVTVYRIKPSRERDGQVHALLKAMTELQILAALHRLPESDWHTAQGKYAGQPVRLSWRFIMTQNQLEILSESDRTAAAATPLAPAAESIASDGSDIC